MTGSRRFSADGEQRPARRSRTRSQHQNRPSPSVRSFPIEGGLLLLDRESNCLIAYNDSARHVWDLIEAGRTQEHLVSEFAAAWGIPIALARADIQSIMAEWRTRKILVGSDRDWYPSAQTKSASEMVIDSNVRADPDWASEWICTIRGTTVLFAVVHDLHPHVRTLFGHLETPGAAPRTRIEIRRTQSGELALLKDGRERMRTIEPALAIGALHVVVLECIRPSVNWFALLHGAALARKGNGLALVGLSGSGKSTLAAGLLSAGFDYLADDLIALSSPDGAIVPWPLPLSVKPGSIEVLTPRYPELARASRYLTKGVEARLLIPPAEAWDLEPVKLSALLFPRFVDSSKPELQRLSAFQAIERLLKDRVWLGDPITEERVESFLKRLHHTPAYALSYGNLDDGIGLVEEVIT